MALLATLMAFGSLQHEAKAALTLDLLGTIGSNVIQFTAGGSVTAAQSISQRTSSVGTIPSGSIWSFSYNLGLGEFLEDSTNPGDNNFLTFSTPISYRRNGVEFGVLSRINLEDITAPDPDRASFTPPDPLTYPALSPGDVVSWVGSGTFTLSPGYNFEDAFSIRSGTFTNAQGNFTLSIASVPEPSLSLLLGLGGLALAGRRRRQVS